MTRIPGPAAALCAAFALTAGPAMAQDWSFRLMPYAWLSGLDGDVAAFPGTPTLAVDLSFADIVRNLDIAAFVAGEARQGDFFVRGELAWASITADGDTPGVLFSGGEVESRMFQSALAAGWTAHRSDTLRVDAFAGVRYWHVSNTLSLTPAFGSGPGFSARNTEAFFDPILGASVEARVTPDWTLAATGSIGGFGVGADLEYSVTVGAAWRVSEQWSLTAGYRYLAVDYEDDGFVFDVAQHGPFIGAAVDF